jgi:beta-1,4-glucosyltransferase
MSESLGRLVRIGGFAISDCDFASASRRIGAYLHAKAKLVVFFANTHFVVTCQPLRKPLSQMASVLILNDGVGVSLARRLLFKDNFSENMNGTDFIPRLLRESPRPLRVYLLGSSKASVEGCASVFGKIAQVDIAGTCDGYSLWPREAEVIGDINAAKPDILLVALGCPLQERWIIENEERLNVPAIFGVGALFDFVSGQQLRAPRLMRKTGFEWLYRLWREPRRLAYRYTVEILSFIQIVFASASEKIQPVTPKIDRPIH